MAVGLAALRDCSGAHSSVTFPTETEPKGQRNQRDLLHEAEAVLPDHGPGKPRARGLGLLSALPPAAGSRLSLPPPHVSFLLGKWGESQLA